jgi:hypothetical protein
MSQRLPTTVQPPAIAGRATPALSIPPCQPWVLRLDDLTDRLHLRLFLWAPPRPAHPIQAAAGPCLPSTLPIVGKVSSP